MSEELAVLIRAGSLVIRKVLVKRGKKVAGEYIYVRKGLFEAEAEYDVEDGILYYFQVCWFKKCVVWYDGEPDREPSLSLIRRAFLILRELSAFSTAAKVAADLLASYNSRSSHVSSSDLAHRSICL
ncbi:MAG: hypothetical protein ABWK05_01235 [Pyrobaculum sp.]